MLSGIRHVLLLFLKSNPTKTIGKYMAPLPPPFLTEIVQIPSGRPRFVR